jgi:hypothetical protein
MAANLQSYEEGAVSVSNLEVIAPCIAFELTMNRDVGWFVKAVDS